jgi:hypothetical protein
MKPKKITTFMCACGKVHKESTGKFFRNWLLCKKCYTAAKHCDMTQDQMGLLRYFDHNKFAKDLKRQKQIKD